MNWDRSVWELSQRATGGSAALGTRATGDAAGFGAGGGGGTGISGAVATTRLGCGLAVRFWAPLGSCAASLMSGGRAGICPATRACAIC